MSEYKFPYPVVASWVQLLALLLFMVSCDTLSRAYSHLQLAHNSYADSVPSLSALRPVRGLSASLSRALLPVSISFVAMVSSNNLCLQYFPVASSKVCMSI